jgi:hypothetical protein
MASPYPRFEITCRSHIQESKIHSWLNKSAYGTMASWFISGLGYRHFHRSLTCLAYQPACYFVHGFHGFNSFCLYLQHIPNSYISVHDHTKSWGSGYFTFLLQRVWKENKKSVISFQILTAVVTQLMVVIMDQSNIGCLHMSEYANKSFFFLSAHGSHTPISTVPRRSPCAQAVNGCRSHASLRARIFSWLPPYKWSVLHTYP